MKTNTKIKLSVVLAVVIAVASGGVALAATEPWSPKEESQAVIDDAAKQLGVKPSELSDALKQALKNRVDAAVAAGRVSEAQGAKLKEAIDSNEVPLPFGFFGPIGVGPDLDQVGPFGVLATASNYLGISEAELRSRLESGKTPRSLGANAATMIARELGVTIAPAAPWRARAAMRVSIVGASAQARERTPNARTRSSFAFPNRFSN